MDLSVVANICKALGDTNRLNIIKTLTKTQMCGCELLEIFEITQPTLSHHMKILCECGLVNAKKDGKWSYYSINCDKFCEFKEFIAEISCCETNLKDEISSYQKDLNNTNCCKIS